MKIEDKNAPEAIETTIGDLIQAVTEATYDEGFLTEEEQLGIVSAVVNDLLRRRGYLS